MSEQKKLDRPELRELPQGLEYQLDSAQLREWVRERDWRYLGGTQEVDKSRTWHYMSPNGVTWELVESWGGKIISILALIPDKFQVEEEFAKAFAKEYRKDHKALHKVDIEEAKREERIETANALEEWMDEASPYRKIAQVEHAIIKLKRGQALKEEK